MSHHRSPFDHQFEKLMNLRSEEEREELFAELLHHGPGLFKPLSEFLTRQNADERLVPLLDLLGKIMDERAVSVLMRYLDSEVTDLRCQAATSLGWNSARAALETLDRLEGTDPEDRVRLECRAAIEEILRDYPNLRETLSHHHPLDEIDAELTGEREMPPDHPDSAQKVRLMAALPRVLATKYNCIPLHFSADGRLQIAVPGGYERQLVAKLARLTGRGVDLHMWDPDRIQLDIEKFYTLGDDDFSTFISELTEDARKEVVETILDASCPEEPGAPLNEANDGVEGAQLFLSAGYTMDAREVMVQFNPPEMAILGEGPDSAPIKMDPPVERLRERFLKVLLVLAGMEPGEEKEGLLWITNCSPACRVRIRREGGLDIRVFFEKE